MFHCLEHVELELIISALRKLIPVVIIFPFIIIIIIIPISLDINTALNLRVMVDLPLVNEDTRVFRNEESVE